ncbi:unnamed protein product [Mytilus coruscus]|uniref:Core-binding (CB) domain-containing protein n=1 Tax=Mytilus coruscus TaxID=42192 RepID=A0A6J8CNK4_MYTCO|nr:unnamed protein product [Mytilus coruscus]
MQQALGTLLSNLENDNASKENGQLVKDLIAMSTKFLDQIGRGGVFHHMIRRICAATNAGISNLNDIQAKEVNTLIEKDAIEQVQREQIQSDYPISIPIQSYLLRQPRSQVFHPDPGVFSLTTWLQSTDLSKQRASKEARNLLSASWRKGTQKDYSAKFKKYFSWCSTREINPHYATLNQVADCLAHLFENGLQYRTIAGSCSDLQSLTVKHSFMRIQQKVNTFIRCGLTKQDRQNHINLKLVVPAFTDNKKLDPVTCLLQYLERTKKFRSSLDKDQQGKLFLSI